MEHVILIAFTVEADTRAEAESVLAANIGIQRLNSDVYTGISSWWVADDDRHDGSDLDSAVFVTPGFQARASRVLHAAGLTAYGNVIDPSDGSQVFPEDLELVDRGL